MDMYYEISIISWSYGVHRQHTSEDGQNRGSGISSLTPKPETLSKLFNQGAIMEETFMMFFDLAVSDKHQHCVFHNLG